MPFPTNTTRRSLASALDRAQSQADSIKRICQNNKDRMAAGTISSGGLMSLLDNLIGAKSVLLETASLPGIGAFAEAQVGQSVTAEFTAMMGAIDAAGAWIVTNFPKNAQGYLLAETWGQGGARVERSFATADTAGLRTLLDAVIAAID